MGNQPQTAAHHQQFPGTVHRTGDRMEPLAHRNPTDHNALRRNAPAEQLLTGGLIPHKVAVGLWRNPFIVGLDIGHIGIEGDAAPGGLLVGRDVLRT